MKKWIMILVIIGLFGYTVYEFIDSREEAKQQENFTTQKVAQQTETEEGDPSETGIKKGNMAPDFELTTVDGEAVKLSDFQGQKVLLNFWATWCPPCRAEMPDMQKFHEKNEDAVILAVNLRETENSGRNVEDFLEEHGITFQVLLDEETTVANTYNAQALPTSYLINTDGTIHNVAIGPLNYDLMVEAFDEMD